MSDPRIPQDIREMMHPTIIPYVQRAIDESLADMVTILRESGYTVLPPGDDPCRHKPMSTASDEELGVGIVTCERCHEALGVHEIPLSPLPYREPTLFPLTYPQRFGDGTDP